MADDMWLRITNGTETQDIPVTGVGGTVRIAVGAPGLRSSVWRIWADKGKSDVYIASRTIIGVQKFSLHQSGDWRYAFTSDFMDSEGGAGVPDRIIDRWRRPEPGAGGWIRAITIWVRAEDVTPIDDTALVNKGITWLTAPTLGQVVGVHVALWLPNQEFTPLAGLRVVDILRLANDEAVAVLSVRRDVEPSELQMIADARARLQEMPPEAIARQGEPGVRLGLFGNYPDGIRWVYDTAF